MKRRKVQVVSVWAAIFFSFLFASVGNSQVPLPEVTSADLCGPIVHGLEFCTKTSKVTVRLGEPIVLSFSVRNATEEERLVKTNRDFSRFTVKVTDQEGNVVLTKAEKALRKGRDASEEELKDFVNSIWRRHHSEMLGPDQILREKLILTNIYDFTQAGTYFVEIARNTMNPTGNGYVDIPLGMLEIEVKTDGP